MQNDDKYKSVGNSASKSVVMQYVFYSWVAYVHSVSFLLLVNILRQIWPFLHCISSCWPGFEDKEDGKVTVIAQGSKIIPKLNIFGQIYQKLSTNSSIIIEFAVIIVIKKGVPHCSYRKHNIKLFCYLLLCIITKVKPCFGLHVV